MSVKSEDDEQFDRMGARLSAAHVIKSTACVVNAESLTIAAQRVVDCSFKASRHLKSWQQAENSKLSALQDYYRLLSSIHPEAAASAASVLESLIKA